MTLLETLLQLSAPTRPEPGDISPADPVTEALEVLRRLKCYTLPAGRMAAARLLARGLEPLLRAPKLDPARALTALQQLERDLIALGGRPDPELAAAVELVERVFPGARLVQVKS